MSDYFSNFNDWKNTTGVEVVYSNGTEGDSALYTIGSSWLYQQGDTTTHMIGNMGWKQTGVSSSLIEGFSFYTVLGMNINDTVGIGMDNYAGLRVGINGGLALDVNVAGGVRLSYGPYYEIDKTWKTCLTLAESIEICKSQLKMTDEEIKEYVKTSLQVCNNKTEITANTTALMCTKRETVCTTSYSVSAPEVTLNGPGSLTAKTAGIMYFEAGNFAVIATASATIQAKGILKLQ